MATTNDSSVSFDQTDTRSDEMHNTIEAWIDELITDVNDAQASAEFQEWLDIQSRFHDYSYWDAPPTVHLRVVGAVDSHLSV